MPEEPLDRVRHRRLYQYLHSHRHGDDGGLFWASPAVMENITKEQLGKRLGIDYEHERSDEAPGVVFGDERLEWSEVSLTGIKDISDPPTIGAGDPLKFLAGLNYDLLWKQRMILLGLLERDDLDLSDRESDALDGVTNMLEGIQDLGSDVFRPAISRENGS